MKNILICIVCMPSYYVSDVKAVDSERCGDIECDKKWKGI